MSNVAEHATLTLGPADAEGQAFAIGVPEPVFWRDVIVAFENGLGREVQIRSIPIWPRHGNSRHDCRAPPLH